jgi:hypothetical protein
MNHFLLMGIVLLDREGSKEGGFIYGNMLRNPLLKLGKILCPFYGNFMPKNCFMLKGKAIPSCVINFVTLH